MFPTSPPYETRNGPLPTWPQEPGQRPAEGPPPTVVRSHRTGRAVVAGFLAAVLFGGGGYALGHLDQGSSTLGRPAAVVTTAAAPTEPPPLSGNEAEPAAAVARVLSPAVVQIETGQGLGSGFVYDPSGLVMTAAHVVGRSGEVQVRTAEGTALDGEVLGADPATDIAVVQVDGEDLPVAQLATGQEIEVGQTAIAIGSPFGLDQTVTAGIVSAVGRSTETPGGAIPMIQTDAPINPGNSGGALADRYGRVIGINDSIAGGNGGNVGVGFAIPIDTAREVADRIVAGEPIETAVLGVSGADSRTDRNGALVLRVEPGSGADDAGLSEGDLITEIDGQPVQGMLDLTAGIRSRQPGDEVDLTVVRDGEPRSVTVELGR